MHKVLLSRDTSGSREQQAYFVSSVITDFRYKQLGLAFLLLKRVAKWLDGLGDDTARHGVFQYRQCKRVANP